MKAGSDCLTVLKSAGVKNVLVRTEGYGTLVADPEAIAEAVNASRNTAIEIADDEDEEEEEEEEEEDAGLRTGWGECPMCTEVT